MRLFEIEDEQMRDSGQAGGPQEADDNPLLDDVSSLILRLEASDVQKVRFDNFVQELNNVLNVPIDVHDADETNSLKELITGTGKAEIKGEYVLINYQTPENPGETDTQKIAMKNIRNSAS